MKKQEETVIFKDGHINENGEFIVKFIRDEEVEKVTKLSGDTKKDTNGKRITVDVTTPNGSKFKTKGVLFDKVTTKVDAEEERDFANKISGEYKPVIDLNKIVSGLTDAIINTHKTWKNAANSLTDKERAIIDYYGHISEVDIFIAKNLYRNIEDYVNDADFFKTYANIDNNDFIRLGELDRMRVAYTVLTNVKTNSSDFCRTLLDLSAA